MNQLFRTVVVTSTCGLAACMLLLLGATNCSAQDYPVGILQIRSPADGTVVHPGQTVHVGTGRNFSDLATNRDLTTFPFSTGAAFFI